MTAGPLHFKLYQTDPGHGRLRPRTHLFGGKAMVPIVSKNTCLVHEDALVSSAWSPTFLVQVNVMCRHFCTVTDLFLILGFCVGCELEQSGTEVP